MVALLLFLILLALSPTLALGLLAVVGIVLVIVGVVGLFVWLIDQDEPTATKPVKPVKQTRDPELYEWNEFDRIGAAKDWNRANVEAAKKRKK